MLQTLGSSSQDVLATPVHGGRSLTTAERRALDLSSAIPGWGSDLDPKRRPGVPRDKAPEIGVEFLYPGLPRQEPRIKIHKSTEHGQLPPVFGTSCPPSGLSGRLRDYAYRFSEGRLLRWLTLMLADRVNVVEGVITDLSAGQVPNIPKEMGLRAELEHNGPGFAKKVLVVSVGTVALMAAWRYYRRR